jgi:hypothetical protein
LSSSACRSIRLTSDHGYGFAAHPGGDDPAQSTTPAGRQGKMAVEPLSCRPSASCPGDFISGPTEHLDHGPDIWKAAEFPG